MHKHFFKLILFSLLLVACQVAPKTVPQSQIETLAKLLQSLERSVPHKESLQLSRELFQKTKELTKEFKLTSPPLWHNFLVNTGLRQKGLCFHWADALYLHLKKQKYTDFSFHLVGANIGSYFFEHNALAVTNKKGDIESAVLIDPWRNSGNLYFSKIRDDQKYTWTHRLDRGCR